MWKWIKGRQGGGYDKLPIFISQRWKCDFYLLRMPKGCEILRHKDPVTEGYEHHRINLNLNGYTAPGYRMLVLGKVKRWFRFEYFRPDLYLHSLPTLQKTTYMLSFGWLTKNKEGK